MSLALKRGKVSDIHLEIGNYFKSKDNTLPLAEFLVEKGVNYSVSFENEHFISVYCCSDKKGDKSKKKEKPQEKEPENPRKAMADVLEKYAYSSNSVKKDYIVNGPPNDFNKKLVVIYANTQNHQKVFPLIETREIKENIKTIVLIEGVVDYVAAKELKNRGKQKKESLQNSLEQFNFTSKKTPEKEEAYFETKQELEDFLITLSLNEDIDYKLVESKEESMKFMESTICSLIESNNKSGHSYFDTKTQSASNIAIYAGFEDMYSLMWIEMLMTIPGISEEKAVAIAKKYPTLKSMMEELKKNPGKFDVFTDLEVIHNFDTSKVRHLGKITSSKIVKAFVSRDPEELI